MEESPQRGEGVVAAGGFIMKDVLSDPSAREMSRNSKVMVECLLLGWRNSQAQRDESKEEGVVRPCEARPPSPAPG